MAQNISREWAANGPSDEHQRTDSLPAFLEVAPDQFEPIAECTASQVRAAADSKLLQARELMDDARRLYELAESIDQS